MCGIAGFALTDRLPTDLEPLSVIKRMTDALIQRGPDDAGHWIDLDAGIALGHRRLSILDLSPQGHQPMVSHNGRYVIAFNGEIYNYTVLRIELEQGGLAHPWRGHSDTEVLLAAVSAWGLEATLTRLVGMFAFALWDRQARNLTLARDRLGEKPLYYGWAGKTFLFGSELKALRNFPGWRPDIDRDAVAHLLRHSCIPAPLSIYPGIRKLSPGTYVVVPLDPPLLPGAEFEPHHYWRLHATIEQAGATPFAGSPDDASNELERLIKRSIAGQMVADVPLGAFLSGGIDSTTVVALMQAQSARPIRTFTIGFREAEFNEARHAHRIAQHLGTEHTELYVSPQHALSVIPRLPSIYDEPFADASQIPTFMVAEMARNHVTVALSGDGGDELLGGYNRHVAANGLWRHTRKLPKYLRNLLGRALVTTSPVLSSGAIRFAYWLLHQDTAVAEVREKVRKAGIMLSSPTCRDAYRQLVSHWLDAPSVVVGARQDITVLGCHEMAPKSLDFPSELMLLDTQGYLPDDILVKVDRAAMAVSLETRIPYLDHRLIEFAWSLPTAMKIAGGRGKLPLRNILDKYVPSELMNRPKTGFTLPLGSWLRGPLREWAETLLDESRLRSEGFFDPAPIRRKWTEHLAGSQTWQYDLWNVLMFQAWLDEHHGHRHEATR